MAPAVQRELPIPFIASCSRFKGVDERRDCILGASPDGRDHRTKFEMRGGQTREIAEFGWSVRNVNRSNQGKTMTNLNLLPFPGRNMILVTVIIGFAVGLASPGVSSARQKVPTVSKKCGCVCKDPATGFGELLTDIDNTAGVSCSAYNSRPCSLDGGTRTGKTQNCQNDNSLGKSPQGTLQQTPTTPGPMTGVPSGTIQRRGVEGEQPTSSEKEGK